MRRPAALCAPCAVMVAALAPLALVGARAVGVLPATVRPALPATMAAVVARAPSAPSAGNWSTLALDRSRAVPSPGAGQVLIRVEASSINPVDYKILDPSEGLPLAFPHILGFDVAGVVVERGALCTGRLGVGDHVWADLGKTWLLHGGELGAFAQYAVADESQVGHMPASLNFTEAGSLPLVALTTLQALRKAGAPWAGRDDSNFTVVVTSGAGGTGFVGLQLARHFGATRIWTACSPEHFDFVRAMGATDVIDYHSGSLWVALGNDTVDVVYDNYGAPGTADLAMPSLKSAGGVFLWLPGKGGAASTHAKPGVKQIDFGLCDSSRHEDLDALAEIADAGALAAHVERSFSLPEVASGAAFDASLAGHAVGKLGVAVVSSQPSVQVQQPAPGDDLRVLLTGFEPFDHMADNPSGDAARLLNGTCVTAAAASGRRVCFDARVLSVDASGAGSVAAELAAGLPAPDAVVHLGEDAGTLFEATKFLHVEVVAVNEDPKGKPIVPGGAELQPITFDAGAVALPNASTKCSRRGAASRCGPMIWHRDAGTYYCNFALYSTIAAVRAGGITTPAGALLPVVFVHMPKSTKFAVAAAAPLISQLAAQLAAGEGAGAHAGASAQMPKSTERYTTQAVGQGALQTAVTAVAPVVPQRLRRAMLEPVRLARGRMHAHIAASDVVSAIQTPVRRALVSGMRSAYGTHRPDASGDAALALNGTVSEGGLAFDALLASDDTPGAVADALAAAPPGTYAAAVLVAVQTDRLSKTINLQVAAYVDRAPTKTNTKQTNTNSSVEKANNASIDVDGDEDELVLPATVDFGALGQAVPALGFTWSRDNVDYGGAKELYHATLTAVRGSRAVKFSGATQLTPVILLTLPPGDTRSSEQIAKNVAQLADAIAISK